MPAASGRRWPRCRRPSWSSQERWSAHGTPRDPLDLEGRRGWLTSRALVFAGEASFALYLVHEVVILNLKDHLDVNGWVAAGVMLAVSCLAAVVLHLAVERPFNTLLRGRSPSVALASPPPHGPAGESSPPADPAADPTVDLDARRPPDTGGPPAGPPH